MTADTLEIICMRLDTYQNIEVKLGTKLGKLIFSSSINARVFLRLANSSIVVIVKVRGSAYRHTAASCLRVLRTTRRYLLVISGQG